MNEIKERWLLFSSQNLISSWLFCFVVAVLHSSLGNRKWGLLCWLSEIRRRQEKSSSSEGLLMCRGSPQEARTCSLHQSQWWSLVILHLASIKPGEHHTSHSFLTVETRNRRKPWKESDPLKQEKDLHKEISTKNRNSAGQVKVAQAASA